MKFEDILDIPAVKADPELTAVLKNLHQLKNILDKKTLSEYNRLNSFLENIFDWKDKGASFFGEGKNITVYDSCSIVGDVTVGENTWIGPYTQLDGQGGLKIGKGCSISSGVSIVSHDTVMWALSNGKMPYEFGAIEIGDNCFIGTNAMITKGIKIGDHCVIGAGAVVTKDVPACSIVGGVPGKIIGKVIITEEGVKFSYPE